ncbi:MAG: hypothetical protein GXP30_14220 [Verrucomicrobia bacterium]|nr:hypothetical protein [Verrucomicrobiota bacterium]
MHRLPIPSLLLLLMSASIALAQHDPQRNATQAIAVGDIKKAEKELKKANEADPETMFVRMMLSLKQGDIDAAVKHAQAALDSRMPFARLVVGPRDLLAPLYKTADWEKWQSEFGGKQLKLLHGPMVGAVTHSGASFWVRTAEAAEVEIRVFQRVPWEFPEAARAQVEKETGIALKGPSEILLHQGPSRIVDASAQSDFTAVVKVTGLKPATTYDYEVLIDGEALVTDRKQFTTYPERGKPGKFSVAFGGGAGYVPKWERMWNTIGTFDPAALLMLGDNVYIDQPEHLLTQQYCYYRRQARTEWRRLVASTSMAM